jgi:hypothetical protein
VIQPCRAASQPCQQGSPFADDRFNVADAAGAPIAVEAHEGRRRSADATRTTPGYDHPAGVMPGAPVEPTLGGAARLATADI